MFLIAAFPGLLIARVYCDCRIPLWLISKGVPWRGRGRCAGGGKPPPARPGAVAPDEFAGRATLPAQVARPAAVRGK